MVLSGSNTYTGGTTVQGGTLQLGSNAALGAGGSALTVSAGLLDLNGYGPTVGAFNGAGTLNDVAGGGTPLLTVGSGGGNGAFSGAIQNTSGTVSLVKIGGGTQFLSGTNTYSGTTTVSGGILQFVQPAALYNSVTGSWTAANITVGSQAMLAINVDNAGGFTPSQAGTLFGNLSGSNSGLLAGSSFGIDTTNATAPVVFSSVLQDSAAGSVGFTKLGTGILKVTNASNSYTGPTTVLNGQLIVSGAIRTILLLDW